MSIFISNAISNLTNECAYKIASDGTIDIKKIDPESITIEQIKLKAKELEDEYNAKKYQRDRALSYPPLKEQMDILYHGGIDALKAELKKTKDKYPKP